MSSSDEDLPICETIMADEDLKPCILFENEASILPDENIKVEDSFQPANSFQQPDSFQPETCQREKHLDEVLHRLETRLVETEEAFENLRHTREDDVDLFFKSIAVSVKKLSPELIHEAKLRSLQMLTELKNRT